MLLLSSPNRLEAVATCYLFFVFCFLWGQGLCFVSIFGSLYNTDLLFSLGEEIQMPTFPVI